MVTVTVGEVDLLLVAAKTVTLACGGVLTALSVRAARRTGSRALRALAAGIGLLTVGALAGGLAHQGLGFSLAVGAAAQSVFTAAGLGVMTYSLYAEGTDGENRRRPDRTAAGD